MKAIPGRSVARTIKEYVLITVGLFLYAFGWVGVVLPAKLVGGGVSGMALLIFYATGGEAGGGIPMAYSVFAINALLLVAATIMIGFQFSTKTLYAVIMMSLTIGFLQEFMPPDVLGLGSDKFMSSILGGVLTALGVAICFSQGGSTGGTDIIAMIINKFRTISYGRIMMTCDFIVISLSYFVVADNGLTTVIYSLVVVGAFGYSLDMIMAGNKQSSQIMIHSPKYEEIAAHIAQGLNRGVTLLDAEGWYSRKATKVLMVVCRKNETNLILRAVREFDPDAFISVASVMGAYGQGFDQLKK